MATAVLSTNGRKVMSKEQKSNKEAKKPKKDPQEKKEKKTPSDITDRHL
ncbi:MAG: hypothetical protein HC935_10450 [Pseudanabaena sp. SU_2_4]|nr:hypothetical protein [Pseudanabaena sp. SU_2_4]